MSNYFYAAAKAISPNISEITSIAGSKKSFSVRIGDGVFRIDKLPVTKQLGFVRRLGAMLNNVDSIVNIVGRGLSFKAAGMKNEEISTYAMAAPKLVAAVCDERFEELLIEASRMCSLKGEKDFVSLSDDSVLNDALPGGVQNLIALGLCFLEVNVSDFLSHVVDTALLKLKQIDVSTNTSLPSQTNEPNQSEKSTAPT